MFIDQLLFFANFEIILQNQHMNFFTYEFVNFFFRVFLQFYRFFTKIFIYHGQNYHYGKNGMKKNIKIYGISFTKMYKIFFTKFNQFLPFFFTKLYEIFFTKM